MEDRTFCPRKLRVNLPDNSKVAVQSMGQSKLDTDKHQKQASHAGGHTYVRRYSNPQGEKADAFDTEVIQKFKSSVSQSSKFILNRNNSKGNLYSNQGEARRPSSSNNLLQVSNMGMRPNMSRRQSTPDLSATSGLQTVKENQQLSTSTSESSDVNSGILSRYLGRRQSLDTLSVAKFTIGEESSDTNKSSNDQKTVVSALSHPSSQKPVQLDTTDSESSNKSSFGILSRTRQFGAWLTKATEGEKVEVTKKELNVLAPNSF